MIKMVVFDMAGTAIDENNVVYKTLQKAINSAGYSVSLEDVLRNGAGKEKLQAIKDIVGKASADTQGDPDEIYRRFIKQLELAYNTMDIFAQPGAEKLFDILRAKGVYTVLNTGYDLKTAEAIMKKVGWQVGVQVDGLVTATHVRRNRPYPDMIDYAVKEFKLAGAHEVVKVGDSVVDIEEGKNAGCRMSIGITTGAQTREQMMSANPDAIIDNLLELEPLIEADLDSVSSNG